MLNKQGLFNRSTPSTHQTGDAVPPVPFNAQPKHDAYSMPGHLAAIESANKAAQALAESKAGHIPKAEATTESRLTVGPEVKLKGAEIEDCDTLVVEGRVEATMDSRIIQIAEKGVFSGKVGVDVAEVHGHFDGELTARKQLIVHAGGRVSGKIRYGRIVVEEGGEVSGDVAMIEIDAVISKPKETSILGVREKAN